MKEHSSSKSLPYLRKLNNEVWIILPTKIKISVIRLLHIRCEVNANDSRQNIVQTAQAVMVIAYKKQTASTEWPLAKCT